MRAYSFEKSVTVVHGKDLGYGFVRLIEEGYSFKSVTVVYGKDYGYGFVRLIEGGYGFSSFESVVTFE